MPAWVLGLIVAVVVALGLQLAPVPVWLRRGLSGGRRPALGPAPPPADPRFERLAVELHVGRQTVADALEASRDLAAAAPVARWVARGNTDNWALSLLSRTAALQTEARTAVGRVHESLGELGPEALEQLEKHGVSEHGTTAALAIRRDEEAAPGAVPSRQEARAAVVELQVLAAFLDRVAAAIAASDDPYR